MTTEGIPQPRLGPNIRDLGKEVQLIWRPRTVVWIPAPTTTRSLLQRGESRVRGRVAGRYVVYKRKKPSQTSREVQLTFLQPLDPMLSSMTNGQDGGWLLFVISTYRVPHNSSFRYLWSNGDPEFQPKFMTHESREAESGWYLLDNFKTTMFKIWIAPFRTTLRPPWFQPNGYTNSKKMDRSRLFDQSYNINIHRILVHTNESLHSIRYKKLRKEV